MKFYPPNGEKSLTVGLTSGHMAVIPAEGIELEGRFHKEAISRGALTESMRNDVLAQDPAADEVGSFNRKDAIAKAMNIMLAVADKDEFTNDGKPDTRALSKRCGFTVTRDERDEVWEEVAED